jgi:hypothetical protein
MRSLRLGNLHTSEPQLYLDEFDIAKIDAVKQGNFASLNIHPHSLLPQQNGEISPGFEVPRRAL